jgi:hypothetical protein
MTRATGGRGSFLTLLELVIVLAIVLFLMQKGLLSYFKPAMDRQTTEAARSAGIDTSNYRSVAGSTKDKVRSIVDKRSSDLDAVMP